ncbi:MAG TPA: symmetrical bis(5'-nucleosyl)-tetraphosphatase [Steroidobacteraceae bacterium]|nr:symmetrical bis(5'-nucleosyl)-tetraphosphatase [Steroidobacteraceae bacterium]
MSRYAIGDVQGCYTELRALLAQLKFSSDRDQIWFVGDLVNRGPQSLEVLRFVRALDANAVTVLGNHDLHLLAIACGAHRNRKLDTLDDILSAPDREALLEWLITRPLAHEEQGDFMVHAGLVPQWTVDKALALAREVETALRTDPRTLFDNMYGDEPRRWDDSLTGMDRLRFAINVLTRLRVCTPDGEVELKMKGKPPQGRSPLRPWFEIETRLSANTRIVFGHWSALGLVMRHGVVGLDSGCVWGGSLTALDLDSREPPIAVKCGGYQSPDSD